MPNTTRSRRHAPLGTPSPRQRYDAKHVTLTLRLTAEQHAQLEALAAAQGSDSLAGYVRTVLLGRVATATPALDVAREESAAAARSEAAEHIAELEAQAAMLDEDRRELFAFCEELAAQRDAALGKLARLQAHAVASAPGVIEALRAVIDGDEGEPARRRLRDRWAGLSWLDRRGHSSWLPRS